MLGICFLCGQFFNQHCCELNAIVLFLIVVQFFFMCWVHKQPKVCFRWSTPTSAAHSKKYQVSLGDAIDNQVSRDELFFCGSIAVSGLQGANNAGKPFGQFPAIRVECPWVLRGDCRIRVSKNYYLKHEALCSMVWNIWNRSSSRKYCG